VRTNFFNWLLLVMVLTGCLAGQQPVSSQTPVQQEATSTPKKPTAAPATETATAPLDFQKQALQPAYRKELDQAQAIPYYHLQLDLNQKMTGYRGKLRLEYTNLEEQGLDSLFFRLFPNGGKSYGEGALQIGQVTAAGKSAEAALSMDESVLEVLLPERIAPGEGIDVVIDFQGEIPEDFLGGGYGIYNTTRGVTVLSGWYPILAVFDDEGWNLDPVSGIGDSVYSDAAFYQVQVSVPDRDLIVAATGVEVTGNDDDLHRTFTSGPVREFTLAFSREFEIIREVVEGIEVNVYARSEAEPAARQALEVAGRSLEIFTRRFGPYPYREFDLVSVPMRYAAGVEFPGLILIGESVMQLDRGLWLDEVVAHEVAHQWWYNLVGSDVIDEPWLDEALTTYSSTLYFEEIKGEEVYLRVLSGYRERVKQIATEGSQQLVTDSLGSFEADQRTMRAYSPVVYAKGALFFQAVREKIGERAFFEALAGYYRDNLYQIGTPQELLDAFQGKAKTDLSGLYQQWLYTPGPVE